jgi:hypothetical protein
MTSDPDPRRAVDAISGSSPAKGRLARLMLPPAIGMGLFAPLGKPYRHPVSWRPLS